MTEKPFNHEEHSELYYGAKNYEDLEKELLANHFSSTSREVINNKIVALHVNAPDSINVDAKVERMKELLKDWNVKIDAMRNHGYIAVTFKK